jgi:cell division protease FtsH
MDGFEGNEGVILVAATNRPDVLDPALLRPGRFDRRVIVNKPDVKGREAILDVHTKKTPMGKNVDLHVIARGTPGFSGADLENLVNEAALLAARENKKFLEMVDFEAAKDKVLMGSERRSMVISDNEKKNTAYHESGHTIVGTLLPGTDPVHKVTIIPRGMALGLTQTLPDEDRLSYSKDRADNMIAFLMGGRIAEELIFGQKTTGAGNDIERASDIARRMICEWGMSDRLGPISFGKKEGEVFLGRDIGHTQNYSEATAQVIDQEVREVVERNYRRARELLTSNMDVLHSMAAALLDYETLDADQIEMLMKGVKVPPKSSMPKPPKSGNEPTGSAPATNEGAMPSGTPVTA